MFIIVETWLNTFILRPEFVTNAISHRPDVLVNAMTPRPEVVINHMTPRPEVVLNAGSCDERCYAFVAKKNYFKIVVQSEHYG